MTPSKNGEEGSKRMALLKLSRKTERVCKGYAVEAGSKSGSSGATVHALVGTGSTTL